MSVPMPRRGQRISGRVVPRVREDVSGRRACWDWQRIERLPCSLVFWRKQQPRFASGLRSHRSVRHHRGSVARLRPDSGPKLAVRTKLTSSCDWYIAALLLPESH